MDVRCERCQTEYELDDASIPEAGVPVQCTTCGYTFSVKRLAEGRTTTARYTPTGALGAGLSPPPVPITREDLPAAPAQATWILETEDGKVHRLRDLTTLQKWVVERRVTANDRLSRDGGRAWRELGEVEELIPFFDVVGEADRAKAKGPPSGPPSPGPGTSSSSAPSRGGGGPSVFSDVSRPRGVPPRLPVDAPFSPDGSGRSRGLPGSIAAVEGGPFRERLPNLDSLGGGSAQLETPLELDDGDELLETRRRAPMVVAGLLLAAGLAGGGYYLYGRNAGAPPDVASSPASSLPASTSSSGSASAPSTAATGAPTTATSPGRATEAVGHPSPAAGAESQQAAAGGASVVGSQAAPSPATLPRSAASQPSHPTATTAAGQAPTNPASAAAVGVAGPAPSPGVAVVPLPPPGGEEGSKPAAKDKPPSFDKLVAEGDKLLENGQTNRAEKMYVQALSLKPDGVGALAGTGYVFLDRGRTQKALEVFQRALSLDGRYGPAIFGLAEAYRAQGDQDSALNTYKHYLTTNPSGSDASAARRQVHDLEAAARNAAAAKDSL